jgi:nitric oxide reductase large subunit
MGGVIIMTHDTSQASADWSSVEARMSAEQVMCMASGSVGGVHKYYFFAQEVTTTLPLFSTRRCYSCDDAWFLF